MLKLININKTYKMPGFEVNALKNINLSFRENEFVSILGPSGSGKTTLLNIIGGLDKYTTGDLIINGRSTKTFKERDWDVYRNHRIGFVFQSYNLIPHQTVLSNVELALTISGMSKDEREQKAKDALDKVGLSDQYYKKPNQLSGGQSQRVAIARALVNDPEILLADEPTGALDTKTSKQIMDLIKEIASDRLVIMVTHNPELAEEYSTRIINLLDGELLNDSNPTNDENEVLVEHKKVSDEKAKMSWWTTFKLSLQNLLSKKNRTILTSVASSIGIIGISLVLSLSFGVRLFIKDMQEDMLSGNPITIETDAIDFERMMDGMGFTEKVDYVKTPGTVNVKKLIEELAKRPTPDDMFVKNVITDEYIEFVKKMPEDDIAAVFYDYGLDLKNNLYTSLNYNDVESDDISLQTLLSIYTTVLLANEDTRAFAGMIDNFTNIIKQVPDNPEYIKEQYNLVDGTYAKNKNELMLVLGEDSSLTDLFLAQLGYYKEDEFIDMVLSSFNDEEQKTDFKDKFTYSELMSKTFNWYPNDSVYIKTAEGSEDYNKDIFFRYNAYEKDVVNKNLGIELKIVGILEPKEDVTYGSLNSGLYYTEELTNYIKEDSENSAITNYLKDNDNEISSGLKMSGNLLEGVSLKGDGIVFDYDVNYIKNNSDDFPFWNYKQQGVVGKSNFLSILSSMDGSSGGQKPIYYNLNINHVGGSNIPNKISVYPKDLKHKDNVLNYLNSWNLMEDREDGEKITLSDPLSLVFNMINEMITLITIALIGFTSLALLVSSVMIAIITYVSVVERVKEIGVIRSLGGRKRDVSNLFIAETAIIGLTSGIIAISFTYLVSFVVNLIVNKRIGNNIAVFPFHYALIMLAISITLTLISGLIPSRSAAKKDPVVALRTE